MSAPDLSGITGNYFPAVQKGYSDSLNGSITSGATSMVLHSVSGYSNGDSVFLWVDPGSASAELVWGIVNTGTIAITSMVRAVIGSASAHSNGAAVSQYVSSADHMSMRKGLLVQHNQDGTHKAITTPSVTTTGAVTAGNGLAMSAGAFTPTGSWDGWVASGESWTFNSSTAITVPTDATTKYDVGDFVKITQSATIKYFVVTAVTSTKLTVSGFNNVTVANSAISAPAYSKGRVPHGLHYSGLYPYQPVKFHSYLNSAQNSGNNTTAVVNLDTELYDTGNNFNTSTHQFTAPVNGFYQFNWCVAMATISGAGVFGAIAINNATIINGNGSVPVGYTGGFNTIMGGSTLVQLGNGDTIELLAYGANNALSSGSYSTFLNGFLVSTA